MVQWTLQSNACDVLSLGPRAAGRLATVGVRTVAELLAAKPQTAADRQFSAETIAAWQREARLLIELPLLPIDAARILAAIQVSSALQLLRSTPTQLIAEIENLWRESEAPSWLASQEKPSVRSVRLDRYCPSSRNHTGGVMLATREMCVVLAQEIGCDNCFAAQNEISFLRMNLNFFMASEYDQDDAKKLFFNLLKPTLTDF